MPTFGELVTRISTDLNRGSAHSDRIKTAIVDAIVFYTAQRFAFNQGRSITVTQTAVEYMTLPTDWVEADWMRLERGVQINKLQERNAEWIDDQGANTDETGEPYVYAVQAGSLRLYPIPDASYTLNLSYLKSLPEISLSASDGASNAWSTDGYQVVYSRAMADLLETYIDGEESAAKAIRMRLREDQAFNELRRRAVRAEGSGVISPSW